MRRLLLSRRREVTVGLMPNVGVYLSEELEARIRRLKEKEVVINVSSICQEALDRHLSELELKPGERRVARLVERLRVARTPVQRTQDTGRREGVRWAEETAAWEDIKAVTAWDQIYWDGDSDGSHVLVDFYPVGGLDITDLPDPNTLCPDLAHQPGSHDVAFWEGFREGVRVIHAMVQPELEPGVIDPDDIPF